MNGIIPAFARHRPEDPGVFIGQRHGCFVKPAPCNQGLQPSAQFIAFARTVFQHGTGAMNQQGTEVAIASLADAQINQLVATAMLFGNDT